MSRWHAKVCVALLTWTLPLSAARLASAADEPVVDARQSRRVAEWAIQRGGEVTIEAGGRALRLNHASQVPEGEFQLTELHLNPAHWPRDGGNLQILAGLKHLRHLDVQDWDVDDGDLTALSEIPSLETLVLARTKITNRGLRLLPGLPNLKRLYAGSTALDDGAVRHLSWLTGLERLSVEGTKITADGLAAIRKALPACNEGWDIKDLDRECAEIVIQTQPQPQIVLEMPDGTRREEVRSIGKLPAEKFALISSKFLIQHPKFGGLKHLEELETRFYGGERPRIYSELGKLESLKRLSMKLEFPGGRTIKSDVEELKKLKNIESLEIDTRSSGGVDALEIAAHYKNLKALSVESGRGMVLENLKHLGSLERLKCGLPYRTTSIEHLKNLPMLKSLSLDGLTDESLDTLPPLAELEEFETWSGITDEGIDALKRLPALRSVRLEETKIRGPGLAALNELPHLKSLFIRGEQHGRLDLRHLEGCNNLENLNADSLRSEVRLPDATKLPALKRLSLLFARGFGEDGLRPLAASSSLEDLNLREADITAEDLEVVGSIKSIKHLDLTSTKIDDDAFRHLAGLENLESLVCERSSISDEGIKHLANLKKLKRLELLGTKVGDEGINALGKLADLEVLILAGTQVSDYSVETIASFQNLHTLDLTDTEITNEGLPKLAALKKLKSLTVKGTLTTDRAAFELERQLPGCEVFP